jgi:CRP-like cAMP-binding protein
MTSASGVLRQIEIFSDLRDDQLEWFASSAEELVLEPGDVLLHEGDAADALFVLLEGELRHA